MRQQLSTFSQATATAGRYGYPLREDPTRVAPGAFLVVHRGCAGTVYVHPSDSPLEHRAIGRRDDA